MNNMEYWQSLWDNLETHYNSPEGFKDRVWDADYQFHFSVLVIFWYFSNWPKIQFIKLIRMLPWDFRINKDDSRYSKSKTLYIQPKNWYGTDGNKPRIRIYWSFPGISTLALKLILGGEDEVIGFCFWTNFIFINIKLENVYQVPNYDYSCHTTDTGFCLDWEDGYISFEWMSGIDDSAKFWNFKEFFLGKRVYKSEIVTSDEVLLSFPGDLDRYPCTIQIREDVWTYSRFPFLFKKVHKRCHMTSELGIPKGDSKDRGDRIYSYCFLVENVGEAIKYIKENVMKDRDIFGYTPLDSQELAKEIKSKKFTIEA